MTKPRKELKRTAWIKRGSTPMPRSRLKKHARPKETTLRIYGTPAHRAWMKAQPCAICGRVPSDAAHITNGGIGRKADAALTVPLCADVVAAGYSGHHSEYDGGKRSFVAKYGVDMRALAAATDDAWRAAA